VIRQAPKNPSLSLALIKTLGLSFLVTGLLKFISDLLIFVGPLVLKLVIFLWSYSMFYDGTTDG